VRTQGRGWGCDCRCGGLPSAPSLPCRMATPLWTWPGHRGQGSGRAGTGGACAARPPSSSSRRTLAAAARIGCVQGRLQGALVSGSVCGAYLVDGPRTGGGLCTPPRATRPCASRARVPYAAVRVRDAEGAAAAAAALHGRRCVCFEVPPVHTGPASSSRFTAQQQQHAPWLPGLVPLGARASLSRG